MTDSDQDVPYGDAAAKLERWYLRRQASTRSDLAPWELDPAFMALCMSVYPGDCELVALGGYKSQGARQRLRYMYRGYNLFARSQERVSAITFSLRCALEQLETLSGQYDIDVPEDEEHEEEDGQSILDALDEDALAALIWWIEDEEEPGVSEEMSEETQHALLQWSLAEEDEEGISLTAQGEAAAQVLEELRARSQGMAGATQSQ